MGTGEVPLRSFDANANQCLFEAALGECQDRFSSTILLGGPGMQGTNEEVSPDTSRCWLVRTIKSGSYGQSPGTREALGVSPDRGKVDWSSAACPDEGHPRGGISP